MLDFLVAKGFDPSFGARPLKRAVQTFIENPLAKMLLKGEISAGDSIPIDAKNGDKFQEVDSLVLCTNIVFEIMSCGHKPSFRKNALINQIPVNIEGTAIKNRIKASPTVTDATRS